tara:strand:+ start:7773 stop:8477 length:705 start_codon:yes stop_codon:yes gene_type:complete
VKHYRLNKVMYNSIDKVIPLLKEKGFIINDPWDVVDAFETLVADYAGSKFAISCDSCTNAMFMCLKYLNASGTITIPKNTYLSVPGLIIHSGCNVNFKNIDWSGVYQLKPYSIIDGATRFRKNMYEKGSFHCLSFHLRKILPIGKGGMILTDDKEAADWFKLARYEGRNNRLPHKNIKDIEIIGWNFYMPPEQASRGILLLEESNDENPDSGGSWSYADISGYSAWNGKVLKNN